jgi:carbamoylphosphate synthase large subunit
VDDGALQGLAADDTELLALEVGPRFSRNIALRAVSQAYFALHETLHIFKKCSEKNIFWY